MARQLLDESRWNRHGATLARGQAWDASGTLLRAPDIARRFDDLASVSWWAELAAALNGQFSAVRVRGTDVLAAVDRLRSIPIFFAHGDAGLVVADSAWPVLGAMPSTRRDPLAEAEFRLTGYTTGSTTLIAGLRQIPAGHIFESQDHPVARESLHQYYAYRHDEVSDTPTPALIDELARLHERVFRRLLDDVGDRPLVVPLSGGYDSRLIGVMLRDLGARDVLCYTYGTEANWESRISRELAVHLGFRWTMVPYSAARWRTWRTLAEFRRYFRDSGNASSSPHFQDWPAVHELRASGALAPDAVFVPGHSGDFLAGSHVPASLAQTPAPSRAAVIQAIIDGHYNLWDWPPDADVGLRRAIESRIGSIIGDGSLDTAESASGAFELWDCAERQAKFIVNSMRVYEAFGYEWRLPLFDAELMDFWSRIPVAQRFGRRLYFAYVAARQPMPVTRANLDRAAPLAAVVRCVERVGLKPLAEKARAAVRRTRWRREYEGGTMGWYALVEPGEFRQHYTGHEIAHAYFARKYLDLDLP